MTVDQGFWERAIEIARKHNVMLISDLAYGEVCFDGYHAPSFLAAAGAKEVGVEFTTMSKSYNMAGWRCGFCCGNAQMVKALATIKAYYDYGLFAPIQIASLIAMRECIDFPAQQAKIYQQRRDEVCRGLDRLGWTYDKPRASMFVWAKIKEEHLKGQGTVDFSLRMMDEAAVALAPGSAFGELGEGYVRIALVENEQRLRQAMHNLERALVPRVPRPKRQPAGGAVKQSVD
jgi:alanine-synthesizing transaminase